MDEVIKIALLGYGNMGRMIDDIAGEHKIEIVARFDENNPLSVDAPTRRLLEPVRVLIDFTIPQAVPENIRLVSELKKQMVIGTTGWYDHLKDARRMIDESETGLVYGSNFSLGINLFYKIADYAARLMSQAQAYDPYIFEAHHKKKKDAPSGTALMLKEKMLKYYHEDKIAVSSLRSGYIPGTHVVGFDSAVDTLDFRHSARSRLGFANGALLAARWVVGKKGVFHFEDIINDLFD